MRHKLKVTIFLFLILSFSALSGCSSTTTNKTNTTSTDNKVYDLIWWGLFEDENTMQVLIDKYKITHPNVNIRYVQKTTGLEEGTLIENYREELDENLTDNEPLDTPDIITIHNTWLGRYQSKLVPSTSITKTDLQKDFFPVVIDDFTRINSVYAVPMSMDALALITNTDLMASISAVDSAGPENNWFDFQEQAKRVTKKSGSTIEIAGFAGGLNNVEFLPEIVSLMMLQSNINMVNVDQISGFSSSAIFAQDAESQVILDYFRKFYTTNQTWNQTFDSEVAAFLSKKLVMFIAPSWRLNDILRLNQKYQLGLDVDVYPIPQVNPADQESYIYWPTYWGYGVTTDSQQRGQSQAAWEFIKFLTESEQLKLYNETIKTKSDRLVDIIYPRLSMVTAEEDNQYLKVYIDSLLQAKSWDMIDGYLVDQIFMDAYVQNGSPNAVNIQNEINKNVITKRTKLIN